jgi:hypothetical protein
MLLGDDLAKLLQKLSAGERISPSETEGLRALLNSLQGLAGLARIVDPTSGAITKEISAAGVTLSNDGVTLPLKPGTDPAGTIKWGQSSVAIEGYTWGTSSANLGIDISLGGFGAPPESLVDIYGYAEPTAGSDYYVLVELDVADAAGQAIWSVSDNYNAILTARRNATGSSGTISVGVGTATPNSSAVLDISGARALLVPRLTTTERDALTAANGMIIYNTTLNQMQGRINGAWSAM